MLKTPRRSVIGLLTVIAAGSASHHPATAAPDAYRDLVAANNPILWYRMGEPAGSTTIPNNGTLGPSHAANVFGGVTLGVPGTTDSNAGDTAAGFAYLEAPYLESASIAPASMTGNPSFTAEAVVWVPDKGQSLWWPPFLHWGAGGTGREVFFSYQFHTTDLVYCGFFNGGLMSACTVRKGDWNHFVWVRDSAGGTNDDQTGSRLFVNGIEADLVPGVGTANQIGPPNITATTFRVQRGQDASYRHFDGAIDEIILYDTLLTPEQIAELFEALQAPPPAFCAADLDGNCGVLDLTDISIFTQGFLAQDPIADFDNNGIWDLADISLFITSFLAGCP